MPHHQLWQFKDGLFKYQCFNLCPSAGIVVANGQNYTSSFAMTGSGTSFTVQVNTSRPFGISISRSSFCAWSRHIKTCKSKSKNLYIHSTWSIARVQKCLFGGAWLDLPVSPTTIPSYDTPRFIMFHVQLKINFWARTFCHLSIFLRLFRFGARAALQSLCWHGWRRVSPDGGHSAGGGPRLVYTVYVGISQTWGSWNKTCRRNVPFRISVSKVTHSDHNVIIMWS